MESAGSSPGSGPSGRSSLLFFPLDWAERASRGEFHRLYVRLVHGRACRAGLAATDAAVVAEAVCRRIAPLVRVYRERPDRAAFRGELIELTRRHIAGRLREIEAVAARKMAQGEAPLRLSFDALRLRSGFADDEEWDQEWERHLHAAALERVARQVAPRDFQVFELRVRQQWPCGQVAADSGRSLLAVWWIGWRIAHRLRGELARLRRQLG